MPPKRKPRLDQGDDASAEAAKKAKVDEPAPPAPVPVSSAPPVPAPKTTKKAANKAKPASPTQSVNKDNDSDDDRPMCVYGAKCYRKNPQHHKEFRHPPVVVPPPAAVTDAAPTLKRSASAAEKISAAEIASPSKSASKEVEAYTLMLQHIICKNKLTADEKRMLRTFRRDHKIDDAEHERLLQRFGWSTDEYEDGEKKDDDIELEEEHKVIRDPKGFAVLWIKKEQKKSKEQENVFSKAATRFYQTMSKAQANYQVAEVGVVVNSALRQQYLKKKLDLAGKNIDANEEWGFHGTSSDSIKGIVKTGFLHPDDISKPKDTNKAKSKPSMACPSVDVLDDGYFGKGIYFSFYSDYAMWYSEERESNELLLCKLIRGRCYKCVTRMDGGGCKPGYDSHFSPKGNEIVLFDPEMIYPRYIIKFEAQDAEEREQED